ncbi:unnamed protein product, partial [Ixodes hexagonus]
QRRICLLAPPTTSTRDQRSFYRDTLFRALLAIRRKMEGGTELLLSHNVFEALIACGRRHVCDPSITSPLFHLCACLLHDKADYSKYVHHDMVKAFIEAGGLDLTYEVSCQLSDSCDFLCRCSALLPVLPAAELEDGLLWIRNHLDDLMSSFREFAYKKDIITYWADGEQVKTSVMWERFKENFCRIYLKVNGTPLDCMHERAYGQEHDTNAASSHHSVAQATISRCKSPPLLFKKSTQKVLSKKIARPRAIQSMIQVTFTEASRFPKKARGTFSYPQKTLDVKAGPAEPTNIFEAMSMAPKVAPTILPLQGYANAVKSNIPIEVTAPHHPDASRDCKQPRYKFTSQETQYPWKELDLGLLGCHKFADCSSQPTLTHAFSSDASVRRTRSDPELNAKQLNSPFPATMEHFKAPFLEQTRNTSNSPHATGDIHTSLTEAKSTSLPRAASDGPLSRTVLAVRLLQSSGVGLSTESVAMTRIATKQQVLRSLSSHDLCLRRLPCQRLHTLQEHLFGEIRQSLQMTKAEDRDAVATAMTLMESMMRAINTLTPKHPKSRTDSRLYGCLLCTDDAEDFAAAADQQVGGEAPTNETNADGSRPVRPEGVWFGGFTSGAESAALPENLTSLSDVWLSENLRWKSAFQELAHAPLSSLTLSNGVFYNEEKKHILPKSR